MAAPVQNTNDKGEGCVDPNTNFEQWLQSMKASASLISKMKQFGMDSMEMLEEIDATDKDELKNLANEMGLSTSERIKFQVVIKKVPRQTLNNVIYPEERKAILEMESTLKAIEQSMESIDDTKKKIASEGTKCAKLMTSIYDDIISKVVARRESLLVEFKRISDAKLADLDRAYEQMKSNSVIASSHISSCYVAVNKQVNLNTIDQRKDNILNVAQTVSKMDIMDTKNPLINCTFAFACDTRKIMKWISNAGLFVTMPVPILVSVTPTNSHGGANIKWKLNNVEDATRSKVNKIKVEWSTTEIKDDDNSDDVKVDWTHHKVINVNNINNDSHEMKVDLQRGSYVVRIQYMIHDTCSEYSNIKSVAINQFRNMKPAVQARFNFTTAWKTAATISENGTRVMSKGSGSKCRWVSVTSSTGWNSGKYSWKVKCNARKDHSCDGVGVCTNHAGANSYAELRTLGKSIYYYSGTPSIYKNGVDVKEVVQWKAGDIITVILDCDWWEITFLSNDTDLGTYDLDPNEKYYPALGMCGCAGYDFKLLLQSKQRRAERMYRHNLLSAF
eukprot:983382_1